MGRRDSWTLPMVFAAASAAAIALVWLLAFHTAVGHRVDANGLAGFISLEHPRTLTLAQLLAHSADPVPFLAVAFALLAIALGRRRPRSAAAVVVVLAGSNVATELLKPLTAVRYSPVLGPSQIAVGSYPSGHATASMSLVLCALLVIPARVRPFVAAVGGLYAIGVSYAFLTLGWHYPSDVLGGFLMAATWTMLAAAALRAADARWPAGSVRRRALGQMQIIAPTACAVAIAVVLAGAAAALRPHAVAGYATRHPALLAGAVAIGLLAIAVATAVTRILTPRPPDQPDSTGDA